MKILFSFLVVISIALSLQAKSTVSGDSLIINTPEKTDENIKQQNRNIFSTEASYIGDICTNLSGGLRTGTEYLGMANLRLGFDTQNAGLWNGGQFFINGAVTHGRSPSELLTGDFQVISNIDAGDHIYIHEFWYRHSYKGFGITLGLQDVNVEFAGTENGSRFINSSFGIPPVISDNIPVPIFPLTAPGITANLGLTGSISLKAAVYDGCPTAFEHNVYNTNWHLNTDDGTLAIAEIQWSTLVHNLPGTYKAGYYFHSGLNEKDEETGQITETFEKNYGLYLIADQTIWNKSGSDESISLFTQITLSPADINNHHYYLGGGINYTGFSEKQPENAIGLAVAHAGFNKSTGRNETTIEAYFKKQVCENMFFQPDLQYIINPAGTEETLSNALVGILRFNLNF